MHFFDFTAVKKFKPSSMYIHARGFELFYGMGREFIEQPVDYYYFNGLLDPTFRVEK